MRRENSGAKDAKSANMSSGRVSIQLLLSHEVVSAYPSCSLTNGTNLAQEAIRHCTIRVPPPTDLLSSQYRETRQAMRRFPPARAKSCLSAPDARRQWRTRASAR